MRNDSGRGVHHHEQSLGPKGFDPHKVAVIGDTISDPLKDTSSPFLNILIKLMVVESLVFVLVLHSSWRITFQVAVNYDSSQSQSAQRTVTPW
ncbi:Pyrophosphate-energized vacuolar membrane proton pump 1 [Acorus calamus]|uniref:H(+)-exporting diphosphatase n=1 Tax=Acorus calamus TaxID=4465 RepID=A0AAV9C2H0_ACOCL|nr:Pyrophosphate-energized vacuolar membrane proton pump 1 [Acorus calamus]